MTAPADPSLRSDQPSPDATTAAATSEPPRAPPGLSARLLVYAVTAIFSLIAGVCMVRYANDPVPRFFVLLGVIVLTTLAGTIHGRSDPAATRWSAPLHDFGVYLALPIIGLLSMIGLKLTLALAWLPVLFALFTVVWFAMGFVIADRLNLSPSDRGTFVLAVGLTNCGPTMVTSMCYVLLEPSEQALGMSNLFCLPWTLMIFTIAFPLGGRFGQSTPMTLRGYFAAVFHPRSLAVAFSLIGLTINLIDRYLFGTDLATVAERLSWLVAAAVLGQTALFYYTIGLTLRLNGLREHMRLHIWLAFVRFILSPTLLGAIILVYLLFNLLPPNPAAAVLLLQSIAPVGIFSTVIAQATGLNVRLASQMFVVNTAAFLLLPLPLFWLIYSLL